MNWKRKLSLAADAFWYLLFGVTMGGVSWEMATEGPNQYHAFIPPILWIVCGLLYGYHWLVKSLAESEADSLELIKKQGATLELASETIDLQRATIADQMATIRALNTVALCEPSVPGLYQIGNMRAVWDGESWSWPKIESVGQS